MTDEILYAAVTVAEARITVAAVIVVWEMLDLLHTVWKDCIQSLITTYYATKFLNIWQNKIIEPDLLIIISVWVIKNMTLMYILQIFKSKMDVMDQTFKIKLCFCFIQALSFSFYEPISSFAPNLSN